jgi:transcription elongation factor GreA
MKRLFYACFRLVTGETNLLDNSYRQWKYRINLTHDEGVLAVMKKQFYLTKEGIGELETELTELKKQRGPIAERIKTAREFGDLSENAEYSSARQEQERAEARIADIENILLNVAEIKKPKGDNKVQLGTTVKLKSNSGKAKEFQIVGTVEADPLNGKISDESPIGRALLGKKEGEDVEIKTPVETAVYKIVSIA